MDGGSVHGHAMILGRIGGGTWGMTAAVVGSSLVVTDAASIGIALPTIARDLQVGIAPLQLAVTTYTVTVAGLVLLAGALADRWGHPRVYALGTAWFTAAAIGCAVAWSPGSLVLFRALQGVGAAMLLPTSLALVTTASSPGRRAEAIGRWAALGWLAAAVTPMAAGWLVQTAGWRWIFVLDVPAGAAGLLAARHLPATPRPAAVRRFDLPGAVLVTTGLLAVSTALVQGPARAWSSPTVVIFLVFGSLALVAFVARQRLAGQPLVPPELWRSRQFQVTDAVTFLVTAGYAGAMFLLPWQLQLVAGYSPLASAAAVAPIAALMLLLSARLGTLARTIGPRAQTCAGPILVGSGLALLARVGATGSYPSRVLPPVLLIGAGLATGVAALTSAVLASVPPGHVALASAVNTTVARAAALFSIALLPAAAGIGRTRSVRAVDLATGFGRTMTTCALLCLAAGVLAGVAVRSSRPEEGSPTGTDGTVNRRPLQYSESAPFKIVSQSSPKGPLSRPKSSEPDSLD